MLAVIRSETFFLLRKLVVVQFILHCARDIWMRSGRVGQVVAGGRVPRRTPVGQMRVARHRGERKRMSEDNIPF